LPLLLPPPPPPLQLKNNSERHMLYMLGSRATGLLRVAESAQHVHCASQGAAQARVQLLLLLLPKRLLLLLLPHLGERHLSVSSTRSDTTKDLFRRRRRLHERLEQGAQDGPLASHWITLHDHDRARKGRGLGSKPTKRIVRFAGGLNSACGERLQLMRDMAVPEIVALHHCQRSTVYCHSHASTTVVLRPRRFQTARKMVSHLLEGDAAHGSEPKILQIW
jgi:hypothetical protein